MTNTLHILTSTKIPQAVLTDTNAGLLLLREALYLLLEPLPTATQKLKIYAMEEDLLVRGIPSTKLATNVELIDYQRFVDLSLEYQTSISW